MTAVPTLSYTLTSEILILSFAWSLKKVYLLWVELPYIRHYREYSPAPLLYFFLLWHWFCVLLASTVDYYRVDKEDIVTGDTQETAPPPALPPVAQTLPSQPLDVLFIERRGELTSVLSNIPVLYYREACLFFRQALYYNNYNVSAVTFFKHSAG